MWWRLWRTGEVVLLLVPAVSHCLHTDIIGYSILQFIKIRRFLVNNLVSNGWGGVPHPYTRVSYMSLTWDWGLEIVNWVNLQQYSGLTVLSDQWVGNACASSLYEGSLLYIITPSSWKKTNNSVGNVGSVGKSEKSPDNVPRKVLKNAYTDYTDFTDIGLDLH